jgi:hypothetical protein
MTAQHSEAPHTSLGAWLPRFGFWCSIIAGVIVGALILGSAYIAFSSGTPARWVVALLAVAPLVALVLANAGTGLNYYGVWRVVRGLDEFNARDDALSQGAGAIGDLQGAPAVARAALGCGSLFSVGILAVSLLTAALSYLPAPLPHVGVGLADGFPPPTQIAVQATATPSATTTTVPSPAPTQLPTASPTATARPRQITFNITGANAFNPASFSGLCASSRTFSINGTILAQAGAPSGNATYRWARSDGSFSLSQTIAFAAGQTSRTVTDSWTLQAAQGTGARYTDQIQVSAPNARSSTLATFTFGCQFVAQSASASANPTVPACTDTQVVVTGVITFSPSPGGTVTYHWIRNGSSQSTQTFTLAPGETSATVTDFFSLSLANFGTNTDAVTLTTPNAITSNQATFTFDCGIP